MVGLPNRTGRCAICKRLKVKCDLLRPACSRCRRVGLRCEYVGLQQQGHVFINRSVTDPYVNAVDIVSKADKTKLLETAGSKKATIIVPARKRILGPRRLEFLGAGRRDPFANYPLHAITKQDLELLDHFFTAVAPRQFALDNRKEAFVHIKQLGFTVAVHDVAAFHLILSCAASDLKHLRGINDSAEEIGHNMAALRVLNERMMDISLATSDGNLCAVAIFAGCEILFGPPDNFHLHMKALEQIVNIRGGLQSIRSTNPPLEQYITWIDYAGAANLISRRRFSQLSDSYTAIIYSPVARRPPNSAAFTNVPERYDLYRDLIQTIKTVETVMEIMRSGRLLPPITPKGCSLVGNLDRELYQLFLVPEQYCIVGRRCFIQQAWRFAAMICLSAVPHLDLAKLNVEFPQGLQILLNDALKWGETIKLFIYSLIKSQRMGPLEITERLLPLMNMAVSLTSEEWRTVKVKLLGFFVQDEICQGPLQDLWRSRLPPRTSK